MDRIVGFAWVYFRVIVLPLSIVYAAVGYQEGFSDIFWDYVATIAKFLPITGVYWGDYFLLDAALTFVAAPFAIMSWIIPNVIKYPLLAVASITGQYGIAIVIWACCWKVPFPRFLRRKPESVAAVAN